MKNIALCISGYFSNQDGDDLMQTNYIYDNIINKILPDNNIDIFIHSFDFQNTSKILTKYPTVKKYIIEPQIDFTNNINELNKEYIAKIINLNAPNPNYWFTVLSGLYSRKQSIILASDYSKENNIQYDCICWIRFDLGIRVKVLNLDINCCTFPAISVIDMDNTYLYSAFWKQLNAGPADYWFFSNIENMRILADAYDYVLENAFKLNSDFILALDNWPDSNADDDFSNEILIKKPIIQSSKRKYTFLDSMNSHLLLKFYLISTPLYKNSRFLHTPTN